MARHKTIQTSFNAGEWSGLMHGRTEIASYKRACKLANNFQIVPQGGLTRRSGSRFVSNTKISGKRIRLEGFIFSDIQAYVIEFGEFYIRFYSNEGILSQQTLANLLPAEQVATTTDEFTFVGHGYNLDDGPVKISSTGTVPTGLDAVTNYWIKPATTLTFAPADIDSSPNEDITIIGHDLTTQMGPYRWSTTVTLPAGMSFDTDYYLIRVDDNRFQVSLAKGGAAEAFTGVGSGVLQLIPTDAYKRDVFRLQNGPGGQHIAISAEGTGLHTITPQSPIPSEIVSPYTEAEVDELQVAQSADVLYITHKDHEPRTLSRFSPSGFALELFDNVDGPYFDENPDPLLTMKSSAVTGKNVTLTAERSASPEAFFRGTDVGRTVRIYDGTKWGYAKIVGVNPNAFDDPAIAQSSLHATPATAINVAGDFVTFAATHSFDTGELIAFKEQIGGSLSGTGIVPGQGYYFNNISGTTGSLHNSRADAIANNARVDLLSSAGYAATVTATSSVIDILGHGFIGGEGPVQLTNSGGALPEGLSSGTDYYIGFVDSNALTLSLSRGGAPAPILDRVGGGTHTVHGDALPLPTCTANVLVDFGDTVAHASWRISAWGAAPEIGFPRTVTFHEQRLWFAATRGQPDTLFASRTGAFTNFGPTGTPGIDLDNVVGSDNGLVYEIGANEVNVIQWMSPTNTLVLGTSSSNWTLAAALAGEAITPTNVQVRRSSAQGSADLTPVIVGERVISVSKTKLKLFSLGFSFETDSFTTEDLTLFAEHITLSGIRRVAFAPEPYSTIHCVRESGLLASLTLVRDQRIAGWTRHTLGGVYVDTYPHAFNSGTGVDISANTITLTAHGIETGSLVRFKITSGILPAELAENTDFYAQSIDLDTVSLHPTRIDAEKNQNRVTFAATSIGIHTVGVATNAVVESVAVIPSPEGDASSVGRVNRSHDQIWVVVKRTVNGLTVRHVEFIEDFFAEDDVTPDAFFVDNGITYNSVATASISGLAHLANETIDVLADGRPLLAQVVSSGGVLTLDTAASKVHMGYRYESQIETLRQVVDDAEGTAQSSLGRINHVTLRVFVSLGGTYGHDRNSPFDLGRLLVPFGIKTDVVAPPFTGDVNLPFEGGWDTESSVYITQHEPLPLTLVALLPSFEKGTRSDRARAGTAR